jgi:cobalamin biosynthesis protein CobT
LGWSGLHINYDARSGRFRPVDPKEIKILDYTDGSQSISTEPRYLQEITRVASQGSGLAKHVRRLLQARSAAKYQHGLKRGKISPKSMFRGGMTGTGEYQQKIYRKKQVINLKDTAVQVVVDCSGSMDGDKYVHASASAVLLNEAISTIGVPVEIFGFDDCYRAPQHAIWKTFDKSVTLDELIGRVSTSVNHMMNSNSDGESIMWGYERLMKRRERRKIMIVLSDGSPACSRGDADYYTDQIIKTIEQGGVAEIYGIGIMDRNVTRLYKDHAVIRSAGELESALLNVVQTKILN